MPWLALHIDTTREQEPALSELLEELGAVAVTMTDLSDQPIYEPGPGETPLWERVRLSGLFDEGHDPDRLRQALSQRLETPPALHFERVQDQDWERAWMDGFKPMRFGERLWICPTHLPPTEPGAVNVMLDPGLAFGTGTHPTTAMCLRWLDGHPPRQQTLIDYGCGSGVLAVAALLLGATHAVAVDNDPQALTATAMNARQNGVDDRMTIVAVDDMVNTPVPMVLANILAGPLIELAPRFAELVLGGGTIVLSGILEHQGPELMHAYAPYFEMHRFDQQQQWLCLTGTRKS